MKIQIVDYRLYDYEEKFLHQELRKIGSQWNGKISRNEIVEIDDISLEDALSLTFVKGVWNENIFYESIQRRRENHNGHIKRTQSKRYGPHYLHEYKGRFNPQMPRSLLFQHFDQADKILDPFAGSGTTLIEARGLGIESYGIELNPMAHLISLSKKYYEELESIEKIIISKRINYFVDSSEKYLRHWFPEDQYMDLQNIVFSINQIKDSKSKCIYQIILSNLLREHSLQDPRDLRIRRRLVVPDNFRLMNDFLMEVDKLIEKHSRWINEFGLTNVSTTPAQGDSRDMKFLPGTISGTVSSPPYASALPYVDTYRLSMIALGLIQPDKIQSTEKLLIGSRDINREDENKYSQLVSTLPRKVKEVISFIKNKVEIDPKAGFRRHAVPYSLANYMVSMMGVLTELYDVESANARNYWVLGPNKVSLDGEWFFIDTPSLVGELAEHVGYKNVSLETVQAYPRYNIHSKNSINKESILVFNK